MLHVRENDDHDFYNSDNRGAILGNSNHFGKHCGVGNIFYFFDDDGISHDGSRINVSNNGYFHNVGRRDDNASYTRSDSNSYLFFYRSYLSNISNVCSDRHSSIYFNSTRIFLNRCSSNFDSHGDYCSSNRGDRNCDHSSTFNDRRRRSRRDDSSNCTRFDNRRRSQEILAEQPTLPQKSPFLQNSDQIYNIKKQNAKKAENATKTNTILPSLRILPLGGSARVAVLLMLAR